MPFPYQSSTAPVRTRKPLREREKDREREKERDKDARSVTSTSTRRHREASRSSNRSPLPSSSRPASLYNQANVTLDQLPSLPRSETASPSSRTSPTLRASTGVPSSSTPLSSSAHLYTPLALQQYLESDDNEDFDSAKTPQASATVHTKPYFDSESPTAQSQSDTTQKTAATSPTVPKNPVAKPPSPQEPPTSPLALSRISTQSSDPNPTLQHPRPYHFSASPPAFTQPLPLFGGQPTEPYFTPFPPAPQYLPMAQAPSHPIDLQSLPPQNFYQTYASPPQMQASFNPMRSPPTREYSSTSSRMSFSGDTAHALGPIATLPAEPAPTLDSAGPVAPKGEEDAVLQRIQSAIPDLHLLLNRYRETSGQLGERELTLRHTEAEKMKVLEQKDTYIERLAKERDEAIHRHREADHRHAEEKDKLRLEIGNMTEKHSELYETLQMEKRSKESLEKTLQIAQSEHAMLTAKLHDEKSTMSRKYVDLEVQKNSELDAKEHKLQAKQKEYLDQLHRQTQEADNLLRARTADLGRQYDREKATLETTWTQQRRELDSSHAALRRDLDEAIRIHHKEKEELLRKHKLETDEWTNERQSLTKDWESQLAKMGKGSTESHSQYQKEKEELKRNWKSTETRLKKEYADSIAKMQAENDKLKAGWDADKARFNQVTTELKTTASKLNTENTKLQRLADAFEQKHISALAEEFCSECPPQIPNDVVQSIPADLPPFLVDTPAARQLRLAYVQSLIADVLIRRIFGHFLFTYEHLDDIFNEWAEYLRSKSTKREAIWRQRTLHAAFSCFSSKERINKVAGSIVEEIITAVGPFVNGDKRDEMSMAVKQIVKTAAETWRYARIELSKLSAFPATDLDKEQEGEPLLSVFPRIEREGLPSGIRPDSKDDAGCIYYPGQALCTRSPSVLARQLELEETDFTPEAAQDEQEGRSERKRPRRVSSNIATRVRKFERREDSPVIPPPTGSAEGSRGKVATVSDDVQSDVLDDRYGRASEWKSDAQLGHQELSSGKQEAGADDMMREGGPAAEISPLQSVAPRLKRQTTVTTGSGSEADDTTTKPETLPNRVGAEGNVPGAFVTHDGW
ncbi:MAG: hypothetical protein Q9219_002901 [cf. Caloplaca sp. 3 TL-2023]